MLGAPDFTSKAMAEKSMAALFLKRWWDLRDEVMLMLSAATAALLGLYTMVAATGCHIMSLHLGFKGFSTSGTDRLPHDVIVFRV